MGIGSTGIYGKGSLELSNVSPLCDHNGFQRDKRLEALPVAWLDGVLL